MSATMKSAFKVIAASAVLPTMMTLDRLLGTTVITSTLGAAWVGFIAFILGISAWVMAKASQPESLLHLQRSYTQVAARERFHPITLMCSFSLIGTLITVLYLGGHIYVAAVYAVALLLTLITYIMMWEIERQWESLPDASKQYLNDMVAAEDKEIAAFKARVKEMVASREQGPSDVKWAGPHNWG